MTFRTLGAEIRRLHYGSHRSVSDIAFLLGVDAQLVRSLLRCPMLLQGISGITEKAFPCAPGVRAIASRRGGG